MEHEAVMSLVTDRRWIIEHKFYFVEMEFCRSDALQKVPRSLADQVCQAGLLLALRVKIRWAEPRFKRQL